MKCQKCGKNDVNFHFSSNINGCVTEAHLCAECAGESGYDFSGAFDTDSLLDTASLFDTGSVFGVMSLLDDLFAPFAARGRVMPMAVPLVGYNVLLPLRTLPWGGFYTRGNAEAQADEQAGECSCGGACESQSTEHVCTPAENEGKTARGAHIDEEMQKRREMNALREQMRIAAQNEDFEKAAELRDKLKEMS